MAHEYITYTSSELKELFASVGVPGVILNIDTEAEPKVCSVATDKWGVIEDVPFFYHCEDNTTAKGYSAFKTESQDPALSQVMLLVKNGLNNDKKPNPAYDEIKVVGFYDGKLRKCRSLKLVFRTYPCHTSDAFPGYPSDILNCHWNYYSKYDKCFIYDFETLEIDTDIKLIDTEGEYTLPISYPASYKDIRRKTKLFSAESVVVSDLPVKSALYYSGYTYEGRRFLNAGGMLDRQTEENLGIELRDNGYPFSSGSGYGHDLHCGHYPGNCVTTNGYAFASLLSKHCAVDIHWTNKPNKFHNMAGDTFARIIKPYDPFNMDTFYFGDLSLSEYPSDPILLNNFKLLHDVYHQQGAPYPYSGIWVGVYLIRI